jgi:hypothetical protein
MQTFQSIVNNDGPISEMDGSFMLALFVACILGLALLLTLQWAARNLGLGRAAALQTAFLVTILLTAEAGRNSMTAFSLFYAALALAAFFGIVGLVLSFRSLSAASQVDFMETPAMPATPMKSEVPAESTVRQASKAA